MKKRPSIFICILMDGLGYLTYLLPAIGEMGDIVWAPFSAFIFYRIFGGKVGMIGGIVNFIEEAMPGLDFIPTFTIGWLYQYFLGKKSIEK